MNPAGGNIAGLSDRRRLVHEVASSCAWVMQNAAHVKINLDRITDYYRHLFSQYKLITHLEADHHFASANARETAAYILALDSINFGSGYFPLTGLEYKAIAKGLKHAFERGELNRPEQWTCVTPEYFSLLLSVPVTELMKLFAMHLQASGEKIIADYQGSVMNLLEQSGYSAAGLVNIVAEWDSFHDACYYKGREIQFLKRAQILAADMQLALSGFSDMEALTIFADNMVPHVLRCDGILTYSNELSAKIDNREYINPGSEEEIEIRAAAVHAVELIRNEAGKYGLPVTSVHIDHILWNRGYEPALYQKPSHLTLTTAY